MAAGDGLRNALSSLPRPWSGHYVASSSSTQDLARVAAQSGAPTCSVFVADEQTAGRGRHGRSWLSAPGRALLLSLVLRHKGMPRPWRSTALASVAMAEAIEQIASQTHVAIKWPNDLMLHDRKLAGVLAETLGDATQHTAIVGVGVNVNTPQAELEAIGAPATSLLAATGHALDRGTLLLAFLARIDHWLLQPEASLQATWQVRLWGRGQRVQLADLGVQHEVVILGASLDGALRVRLPDGSEHETVTGELMT